MTCRTSNDQLLLHGFEDFAQRAGQLRVSLTNRCQLNCWFCHNEGDVPPRLARVTRPRASLMTTRDFARVIRELTQAGIKRVFLTGGEPLLSPHARPLLESLPAPSERSYTVTVITNGLTLARDAEWLGTTVDRVKVSLHYFSQQAITRIAAARPGSMSKILRGIDQAIARVPRVELNVLLQEHNRHQVPDLLAYARERHLNVQFIELIATDHNARAGAGESASSILPILRDQASDEDVNTAGTGQARRLFVLPECTVELIDGALGRRHTTQCLTCPVSQRCTEGFWAIRVDPAAGLSPCLLRPDLRLDLSPLLLSEQPMAAAAVGHIDAFGTGQLSNWASHDARQSKPSIR